MVLVTRYGNVLAFEEINKLSRDILIRTKDIVQELGYKLVYANEVQNGKNNINIELIPADTLDMVENFAPYGDTRKFPTKCLCSKPDYYYCYSVTSLLIHLNDYHKMTFIEIGNWLESKGM